MKHAVIRIDGFEIPLIGIVPDATQDKCDRCGRTVQFQSLGWTDGKLICDNCNKSYQAPMITPSERYAAELWLWHRGGGVKPWRPTDLSMSQAAGIERQVQIEVDRDRRTRILGNSECEIAAELPDV